jgi:hypothetical protein
VRGEFGFFQARRSWLVSICRSALTLSRSPTRL